MTPTSPSIALPLSDLLGTETHACVTAALAAEPFRRLSENVEVDLPLGKLCQSIHIERATGEPRFMLGGNATTYWLHSTDSASIEIEELLAHGISSVFLQLYPEVYAGPAAAIAHFVDVLTSLRARFGDTPHIVVDTAGLCMGDDLCWGVRKDGETIDPELSLEWLAALACAVVEHGGDALVVVGRMNYEALVARQGLDRVRPGTGLWGFSTNSETPNAYFDTESFKLNRAVTGQKVLVGNGSEMLIRALHDIHEGLDVVVQKPLENLSLIAFLRALAEGFMPLEVVQRLPKSDALAASFEDGWLTSDRLRERIASARVGVYEVSGTYSMYRLVEDTYSPELAYAMLREQLLNVAWSAGSRLETIVTRQALWLAKMRKLYGP